MLPLQFNAKIWKQGNSLIITIPNEIRKKYNLMPEDTLQIFARLITKEELKEEAELKRYRAIYSTIAEGVIIHKNDVVAQLQQVFFRVQEFREGGLAPHESFEKLPLKKLISGIILKGRFSLDVFNKYYGNQDLDNEYFKKNLCFSEIMKLKIQNGNEIIIKEITFEDSIINNKNPLIKKVKFSGILSEET